MMGQELIRIVKIWISSGLIMLLIGIILCFMKSSRLKKWEPAVGEVVDIKTRKRKAKFIEYYERVPVVKFNGSNGTVIGDDGIYIIEDAFPYEIGSKVSLRYSPTNNNKFYVIHEGFSRQMYINELLILLTGISLIIVGVMFLFR